MKKIVFVIAIFISCNGVFALTYLPLHTNEMILNVAGEKITIINDTSEKLKVHTGSGEVSLNPRGGKTSFSCNPGKSVKVEGKVIFKVTDAMCGKTIKLSDYL